MNIQNWWNPTLSPQKTFMENGIHADIRNTNKTRSQSLPLKAHSSKGDLDTQNTHIEIYAKRVYILWNKN